MIPQPAIGNIGTIGLMSPAEAPQPRGQQEGAAMVRLKPSSTEGVSQRARDFVYIAKECGYPYCVLIIASAFIWYGCGWLGPNVISKAIEPLATVANTNAILAEQHKAQIERDKTFDEDRAERKEMLIAIRSLLAIGQKTLETVSQGRGDK